MLKVEDLALMIHAVNSNPHDGHVAMHQHNGIELIYTSKGTHRTNFENGQESVLCRPGHLQLIPSHCRHDQERLEQVITTFIIFTAPPSFVLKQPMVLSVEEDGVETQLIQQILTLAREAPDETQEYCQIAILSALLHRIRSIGGQSAQNYPPAIQHALAYLRNHFRENISLADIAQEADLSPSRLNALFRQHLDCSPIHYQQDMRMNTAKRLLKDPYMSIQEIAGYCGYDDNNYFARIFRKTQGQSPSAWRKEQII